MNPIIRRCLVSGAAIVALMPLGAATATAYPDPAIPTWPGIPGTPPYPGAYSGQYYAQYSFAQSYTDTRGVRTGAVTADPTATDISMPGAKPGAAIPNTSQWWTGANARYGIQGGVTAPDVSHDGLLPGMVATGGVTQAGLTESPTGKPTKESAAPPEVTNPTPPVYPQLEHPGAVQAEGAGAAAPQ